MLKITFIEFNGSRREVNGEVGQSVMQAAVNNMIPGIIADCGGNCACAACHGYIDDPWKARANAPSHDASAMIECEINVTSQSRLSCQVNMTPELDGIVVHLPGSQT